LFDTDWRIVRADDAMSALASRQSILEGTSNGSGSMQLSADQEKLLTTEYNKSPSRLWLVVNSHATQLLLTREQPGWTDEEKRIHALDAMGYTDDLSVADGAASSAFYDQFAMTETQLRTGSSMITDLKGKK
jgi:hypothetical protein